MATAAAGVVGGWLGDRAIGDPPRAHPVAGFGALADAVQRRWWRDSRLAGVAYITALAGGAVAAAWLADRRLAHRPAARAALAAVALTASLGGRSLASEARGVGRAVEAGDLADARARLPALCGRDPATLDADGLCRAAVESMAENTSDAVVAPLWWAALAGSPGVVGHRAVNTLDAMVGHRSDRHARFGTAAARLDDVLGWIPARLTALALAAAAPAIGGSPRAALSACRSDGGRHASPNAGRCEAAMAGALGVTLGGAHAYRDGSAPVIIGPFGTGPAPRPADIDRAVTLSLIAGAIVVGLCAALAALRARPGARSASGPPPSPRTRRLFRWRGPPRVGISPSAVIWPPRRRLGRLKITGHGECAGTARALAGERHGRRWICRRAPATSVETSTPRTPLPGGRR